MAAALAITGMVAWWASTSETTRGFIFGNPGVIIGLLIVKLLLVGSLAGWVNKMSSQTATAIFVIYSILTGFVI